LLPWVRHIRFVVMKRPNAPTSATEIALFRRCERAWAAQYMWDGWPVFRDQKVFALGTAFHKVAENYVRSGTLPSNPGDPLSEMLMCAMPHLPEPGNFEKLEVRDSIEIITNDGYVPATVTADYLGRTRDGSVQILDYKTSKDPARYGIGTREKKLDDTQTVLYSHSYLQGTGGVWFDHIYIKKHKAAFAKYEGRIPPGAPDAPKAYSTNMMLSAGELEKAFAHTVVEPASRLFQLRRSGNAIDPMSLPQAKDPNECNAYGGCPHRDRCFPRGLAFRGSNAIDAPAAPPTMNLVDWLASRKAAK
jgi:hypothetical protein